MRELFIVVYIWDGKARLNMFHDAAQANERLAHVRSWDANAYMRYLTPEIFNR